MCMRICTPCLKEEYVENDTLPNMASIFVFVSKLLLEAGSARAAVTEVEGTQRGCIEAPFSLGYS